MTRSLLFVLLALCCVNRLFASHIPNIHVYSVESRHEDLKARVMGNDLDVSDDNDDDDEEQVIKVGRVAIHLHNHPYGKPEVEASSEPEVLQRNAGLAIEQKPQQFPDAEPRLPNFLPVAVTDDKDQTEQNGDELEETTFQQQQFQEPEKPQPTPQAVPMNPLFSVVRFLLTPPPRPFFPSLLPPTTERIDLVGPHHLRGESQPHPFAARFIPLNENPIF